MKIVYLNKKNFTAETIEFINDRDSVDGQRKCRACGLTGGLFETIPHHIFFKGQLYRKAVCMPENGALIHMNCHRMIHQASTDDEIRLGKLYDKKLKLEALELFAGKIPDADWQELYKICMSKGYVHGILPKNQYSC